MDKYDLNEFEELEWMEIERDHLDQRITERKDMLKDFTREEYEQALIRYHHPRHSEAMAIRANRVVPQVNEVMGFQEDKSIERHYEPKHLSE